MYTSHTRAVSTGVPRHSGSQREKIMKHLLAAGVFCLLLAATVNAATLPIGRANLAYTVPSDYREGAEEPYLSLRRAAAAASAPAMRIDAMYIDRQAHERFSAGETPFPDRYFFLASLPDLDSATISAADFAHIKQGLAAAPEALSAAPAPHSETPAQGADNADQSAGVTRAWGGILEETAASLSFLLLAEQTIGTGDKAFSLRQAAVSSYLLVGGTVVVVTQYQTIDPTGDAPDLNAAQVDDFKRQALERVRQLNITEGASAGGVMNGSFGKALFGALIGALITYTIMWVRKKLEGKKLKPFPWKGFR